MDILQIMDLPNLQEARLLGGQEGTKNKVLNATFIDAPDGYSWCKRGDFIVTTGYPFVHYKKKEGFVHLLETLIKKECAGIGIKLGRFIPKIPTEAINIANHYKFPIIALPNKLSWSDIIHPIISQINKSQQDELQHIHHVYETFHTHLKEKGSLQDLAKLLYSFQEVPVIIFLRNFNQLICTNKEILSKTEIERIISTLYSGRNKALQKIRWRNENITIRWIINVENLEGGIFLYGLKSNITTWQKVAIEQAAAIVALEVEHLRSFSTTFQRFRNEFLSDLLESKNIEKDALFRKAQKMNWELKDKYKVLLLNYRFIEKTRKTDNPTWRQQNILLELIQHNITPLFPEIIFGFDKNNYLVLLVTDYNNIDLLLHELSKLTLRVGIAYLMGGIGRLYSINNLIVSYRESSIALRVASLQHMKLNDSIYRNRRKPFIKKFSDLDIERIIFSSNPTKEINRLTKEYLQEIINYDKKRNSELMKTLKTYLNCNGELHKVAEKLIVHKNTVRYRMRLIEKLTKLDLKNLKDLLLLLMIFTIEYPP